MLLRLLGLPLLALAAYYAISKGQWVLWIFGPLGLLWAFLVTAGQSPRWQREYLAWAKHTPGARKCGVARSGKKPTPMPPSGFLAALEVAIGGEREAIFELQRGHAYVAFLRGNASVGTDTQAVVAALELPAPELRVRPLPIVEGKRVANTGIQFPKHGSFMRRFLVEGGNVRAVRRWLSGPIREALLEHPECWLVARGDFMVLYLHGQRTEHELAALVDIADVIFAEHGAGGGHPLLKRPDPSYREAPERSKPKKKRRSGERARGGAEASKHAPSA